MPTIPNNPIQSVGGVAVPSPSKYDWNEHDVSAPDAGRTEDAKMHKLMIARKVHLELEWQHMTDADAYTILNAFNSEYTQITYFDYKAMDYLTKTFYIGDRKVSSYNRAMNIATISFNAIEQ